MKNGDSIDLGSGNDRIALAITGTWGTPSFTNLNLAKLDGGVGSDTLDFGGKSVVYEEQYYRFSAAESATNGASLSLTSLALLILRICMGRQMPKH